MEMREFDLPSGLLMVSAVRTEQKLNIEPYEDYK